MTVDEFLAWTVVTTGRFELLHGIVYEMQAERTGHAKVKFRVQKALEAGIERAGLTCCHMLPDGLLVRVGRDAAHEPDALVYCGDELPDDAIEVPAPVIVVEVSSPSTRRVAPGLKLVGYFALPSVHHYLLIDPEGLPLIHHARQADGTIRTSIVASGTIELSPPGFGFIVDGLVT
jgi:Uma2 family endonuclease